MEELIIALKSANSSRSEKRHEMTKIDYYGRLFQFLESRFSDGESYVVKNYFTDYKLVTKDKDNKDKTVYGFIAENGKTYLGLNDLAFPKKLWKRFSYIPRHSSAQASFLRWEATSSTEQIR